MASECHCARSEAIHLGACRMGGAKRYPSYGRRTFAISRRIASEVCIFVCPPRNQRAQGRPGACCTRGLACDLRKQKGTRAYRYRRNTPAFPAQWLYGLYRALPGERLSCLRRSRKLAFANLAPAPRRPNHTTSPYASGAYVYRALSVHRISPRVRDDRERPSIGRDGRSYADDLVENESGIFLIPGLDAISENQK